MFCCRSCAKTSQLPKHLHWLSPLLTQINPSRILPFNQRDLLRPRPSLQLLLPSNRILYKRIPLKPDQPIAIVLLRIPFKYTILVLPDTPFNIARHPNIKIMTPASHNVGVIHDLIHRASLNPPAPANKSVPSLPHSTLPKICRPERRAKRESKDLRLLLPLLVSVPYPPRILRTKESKDLRLLCHARIRDVQVHGIKRRHQSPATHDEPNVRQTKIRKVTLSRL